MGSGGHGASDSRGGHGGRLASCTALGGLGQAAVAVQQLRQVVADSAVDLGEWTASEVGACVLQPLEVVQVVDPGERTVVTTLSSILQHASPNPMHILEPNRPKASRHNTLKLDSPKEVPVHLGVRQIVARDVGEETHALVDVVVVRVLDDVLGQLVLAGEEALVHVEGGQVRVHHLGVVPHTNLFPKQQLKTFIFQMNGYSIKLSAKYHGTRRAPAF